MKVENIEIGGLVFEDSKKNISKQEILDILLNSQNYDGAEEKKTRMTGKVVTRFAPSPTGLMHIGNLYTAFLASRIAQQGDGVFILRIEDTDQERVLDEGVQFILSALSEYDIVFDEGVSNSGDSMGEFGPYIQSQRGPIYRYYAKKLIMENLAYPCFLTKKEMEDIKTKQVENKEEIGIYGDSAKWRDASPNEVMEKLREGVPYVIRLKSPGNRRQKVSLDDKVRGVVMMPENIHDIVLIKQDGLPTYHLAHVVDDYLMGVTDVIRSDEWLPSVPVHLQLFEILGWEKPNYAHISPLLKQDGDKTRKISKRKDPEAGVDYYAKTGYPKEAVKEYFMSLYSGRFQDWREANPHENINKFTIKIEDMSKSGAIFDINKLKSISKEFLGTLDNNQFYTQIKNWSERYDRTFYDVIVADENYAKDVFSIDHKAVGKSKRLYSLAESVIFKPFFDVFYEGIQDKIRQSSICVGGEKIVLVIKKYFMNMNNLPEDKDTRFLNFKEFLLQNQIAPNKKKFCEEEHVGILGDVVKMMNHLLLGTEDAPDLYHTMQTLGIKRIKERILF